MPLLPCDLYHVSIERRKKNPNDTLILFYLKKPRWAVDYFIAIFK